MIYLDLDGRGPGLVRPEQAFVPASDRGLLYGDGLFETMLIRSGTIPLLAWHIERLARSAAALGIPFAHPERAREGALAVAGAAGAEEHVLRLTLTRGPSERRGYQPPPAPAPTLLITAAPYMRSDRALTAVTAAVAVNPDSPTARHKTLSALDKVMARAEAARAGADEALLLNLAGRPAEGAQSNLFIRREGRWLTPAVGEGCLPGVMRRQLIALTGALQTSLAVADLFSAEAVYLTNAVMGIAALAALDGRTLPALPGLPFTPDELFAPVAGDLSPPVGSTRRRGTCGSPSAGAPR